MLDDENLRGEYDFNLTPNPQLYLADFNRATRYNQVRKKHMVSFKILPDYWNKDSPYYSDSSAWITMQNEPIAGHIICHSPEAGDYAEIEMAGYGVSNILKIDFLENDGQGFESYFQEVGWKSLYSGYFETTNNTYSAELQEKISDSPAQKLRQ